MRGGADFNILLRCQRLMQQYVCFAMTINKAQGQTLAVAGLDLHEPSFSHGQLYVGISRVASKHGLTFLAKEGKTKNVVYQEVLSTR